MTYTIKELSQKFHLASSTLRYYEEEGILTNVLRDESGRRIYHEGHVNRLKTICCFKRAGMSISQLRKFFEYEVEEQEHIEDILELLQEQKDHLEEQLEKLKLDYDHLRRKLHYYSDIRRAQEEGNPLPEWKDYREEIFSTTIKEIHAPGYPDA